MSEEKPLHVRVAEALGWREIVCWFVPIREGEMWLGVPPDGWGYMPEVARVHREAYLLRDDHRHIPEFDEDWSATGPLIEKYRIMLDPPTPQDSPTWASRPKDNDPALRVWTALAEVPEGGEWNTVREGFSPLEAVCRLILALHEAGKLKAA